MSKKGGGSQTVRTELDPLTKDYMRGTYGAYNAASAQPYSPYQGQTVAGVSPLAPEATARTRSAANFGMGGMEQMYNMATGNYGALTPAFQQAQQQAIMAANDQATRAGAFGGSRHGVAQGVMQGQVANQQAMMGAQAAQQLAGMGMGANQSQLAQADYYRNIEQQRLGDLEGRYNQARDWDARQAQLRMGAMGGPSGQTQSQDMSRNPLAGAVGGAMTGASIGGLPGGIIGGAGGLLGWWWEEEHPMWMTGSGGLLDEKVLKQAGIANPVPQPIRGPDRVWTPNAQPGPTPYMPESQIPQQQVIQRYIDPSSPEGRE